MQIQTSCLHPYEVLFLFKITMKTGNMLSVSCLQRMEQIQYISFSCSVYVLLEISAYLLMST